MVPESILLGIFLFFSFSPHWPYMKGTFGMLLLEAIELSACGILKAQGFFKSQKVKDFLSSCSWFFWQ